MMAAHNTCFIVRVLRLSIDRLSSGEAVLLPAIRSVGMVIARA
jgi:hypothetical protein